MLPDSDLFNGNHGGSRSWDKSAYCHLLLSFHQNLNYRFEYSGQGPKMKMVLKWKSADLCKRKWPRLFFFWS